MIYFVFMGTDGIKRRVQAKALKGIVWVNENGSWESYYNVDNDIIGPHYEIQEDPCPECVTRKPAEPLAAPKRPTLTECLNALKELVG